MSTRSKRSSTAAAAAAESTKGGRSLRKPKPAVDESMCRVCMRWNPVGPLMFDLFGRAAVQGVKLAEVLSLVGTVQISEDDRLPKLCCTRCWKELERAYKLRVLCQDSDRKLRELFSDVEVTVVKEEYDGDEANPLEVVCKPDVDRLIDEEMETDVVEDLLQPKLEIEADEGGESCNEVVDDGDGVDSDEDGEENKEESKKLEKRLKKKINSELRYPDGFEVIPAVSFRCCGCKKVFETSEELLRHSQEVHADKKQTPMQLVQKLQCEICYKVLSHPHALQNHKNLGKLNYRCKSCGDLFWNKRRANTHFKRLHGPHPTVSDGSVRICCACSEKFETEQQLKEHSDAVHLPEKPPPDPNRPYVCNVCYRNYRTDTHLYSHQTRMMKNSKNHMCVECGKTFKHPCLLRDHEIYHRGEKVFQCPHCPSSYSNKESYRKHVQEHTMPVDKYKCNICGRCFRQPAGLKEHVRLHTGERPLQCPHCPASFARTSCLSAHILTHTGEKNIECPLCGKRFGRTTECQKHVQFVHHRIKRFPCFYCPKRYPRKDYRKRHMVAAHPIELRDNPPPETELYGSPQWVTVGQNAVSQSQQSSTE